MKLVLYLLVLGHEVDLKVNKLSGIFLSGECGYSFTGSNPPLNDQNMRRFDLRGVDNDN